MTHSVESRFLAIVAGTVFILVVPLFALFLTLSSDRASKELDSKVGILLAANSQALAKPLWDFDQESVEQITATIISSDTINRVQVSDLSGGIKVALPDQPAMPKNALHSRSQAIVYNTLDGPRTVGTITIYFERQGLFAMLREAEGAFISIFIVSVIAVIGAAVIGNRIMTIRPLLKLTAAIEATRQLGSHHHVDWRSHDEMGRLAESFNAMQTQLEQEERELKQAHHRATNIYNLTPAMLFSIDKNDCITAVSDYWLLATGYDRRSVIGKAFAEMVEASVRDGYLQRRSQSLIGTAVSECTTKFVCADGRTMDVLLVEARRGAGGDQAGLSLSVMTDVTALKQSEARNHRQAITDHLTGLMNRQGFENALDAQIHETDATGDELACLFIDLDRFKWINDNLGHQAGDIVLRTLVDFMRPLLPQGAIAARLGGDEFAILIRSACAEKDALALSAGLCAVFETPIDVLGKTARLSASIGIALYPSHAQTASDLLQKSDMAMYSKKRDGKNGALLYDPLIQDSTRQRAEIESDIEAGLANDWFTVFFQPIVNLGDRSIAGFEALLRLDHPQKGLLAPAEIIKVAEETGAISRIGNRVLEKALANLEHLSTASGNHRTYLAINFSPLQFEPGLPARLAALTARYNIRPERIVVEITEAALLDDNPQIRTILDEISRFGCRIALDDFGTGYSSLSYLNRFPVNIVKIDQSFIRSICDATPDLRHKSRMLVEGITAISHKMKCTVVAEGVETSEQWELLRQFGVDYGQGYFFARPQPLELLLETIHADTATKQETITQEAVA
ncbi:MAG: putative bifunctional diguanylate cyclase/phosphodiesterase [Allorhizobium sp.]